MFRNYLSIALRHLKKNKLYSLINILGLAIGICSCLLIGMYILDEWSFDRFHQNRDRILRATWEYQFDDKPEQTALTGTKVGPALKRNFPEVESFVRTMKYTRVIGYKDKLFEEKNFLYSDSAFFGMFSFPLIKGDPNTVLDGPDKLVLTQSMAHKYFGSEDPVGQSVKVGVKDFQVTGIAADPPVNSQIRFDLVGSFTSLGASKTEKWNEANYITYIMLHRREQTPSFGTKVQQYSESVLKKEMQLEGNAYSRYHMEPLASVHLHSSLDGFEPNGNLLYLYVFAGIAVLILLIACVNYTNLSTAQSAGRSAEVGMRKVLGARGRQVFLQFISESFLLALLSVGAAYGLSALLMPYFNELSGKDFHAAQLIKPEIMAMVIALLLLITLTAGSYPSLLLSRGRVTQILKSGFRLAGSGAIRKSLIVFQFVVSIFLIAATVVIVQQLNFIRTKDLGYDKEQVVVLPVDNTILQKYDDIKQALSGSPYIASIGGAYEDPIDIGWSDGLSKGSEFTRESSIFINALPVDEDFIKTMKLKIIAGSDYTEADVKSFDTTNNDANLHHSYILNEAAVKAFGWTPEEAIGKTVTKGTSGLVKGVVKDFHFRSLHESIGPLAIFMDKRMVGSFFVKLSGNIPSGLRHLENTWKSRVSHRPFEYHFLDEDFDALYRTEERTGQVFSSFAAIAIILACLGLFALTAFVMVQRTKEIGIRKILGASVSNILLLVSADFVRLVLIAFIIAVPLAWYLSSRWLNNFVYRVSLHWWVFALAGLITLAIAFITITLQAIRTALANPVKNLRTE